MSVLDKIAPRIVKRNRAYRTVFTGPAGEFVRDDLFRLGCIGRPSYVENDAMKTAFNEGKRFMALHVASILNMTDEQILERAQKLAQETTDG